MNDGVDWLYEFGSLLPSIGVGLLFWFAIRALLRADRREREADRQAEHDWEAGRPARRAARAQAAALASAPSGASRTDGDAPTAPAPQSTATDALGGDEGGTISGNGNANT